ncbi:MAG: NTPase [Candidatus Bathyarchaeia archaeon]
MKKRIFILTGAPGTGKTTVLQKVTDALKGKGFSVGGMVSREARKSGVRVGFEILDLTSGRQGWLSHINQNAGPQVGKYRVNLQDLDSIGVQAIIEATEKCQIIVIDEIGPMELYSEKFKKAVALAFESGKLVLAIVHSKATDPLVTMAKQREDAETFTVTCVNRESLPDEIIKNVLMVL